MHPNWVKCRRLEKTETILWLLEDSDSGKDETCPKVRERIPLALAKEMDQEKMEKMVRNHQDERTQSQCWNCGITGHQYKDCLVNLGRWPQQQKQGRSNSPGKGSDVKGKSGKGSGKKGKFKDAGALVWNQQPSPVATSVASSTPQTETSTKAGTVDAIECTALDLCATALTQQEIVNPRWIAFNVDTGAGGTVWPMNAD